jgi:hypothetical protein
MLNFHPAAYLEHRYYEGICENGERSHVLSRDRGLLSFLFASSPLATHTPPLRPFPQLTSLHRHLHMGLTKPVVCHRYTS